MKDFIEKLETLLSEYPEKLMSLPEEKISDKPSPVKWSGKEILGHLIDSASNNHQRCTNPANQPSIVPWLCSGTMG